MVVVAPGRFRMGDASGGGGADEKPVHPVEMAYRFAVGRYEVTRGEFAAFVEESGYKAGGGCWYFSGQMWVVGGSRSWRDPGFRQSDRDPVACVSWHNAKAYLRWLGAKAGAQYRLPSEAEWEYVARAGSTGRFPFGGAGEGLCAYGNGADRDTSFEWRDRSCADGFGARTAPVGSFEPNQFGLHDTIGNLWEWVEDCWHEGYKGAPGDGGAWTASGACGQRIVRGGSWYNEPRLMRPAFRNRIAVANRYTNLGFRPVRALDR
jgi:formylglycine-generating enzyme required for sulfatase activity